MEEENIVEDDDIMNSTLVSIITKGVAILLAVTILFCTMAGCSNTPGEELSDEPTTSEPTTSETESEPTTSEPTTEEPEEALWRIDNVFYRDVEDELQMDTFLYGPEGAKWKIGSDYGNHVVGYNDTRCILRLENHPDGGKVSLWLAQLGKEGLYRLLSSDQWVIDYTLAYDTLYWYNTNREVWACSWQDQEPQPSLYCEEALGVSPYTDEGEGAIVSPDRANWDGYGLPIYSPYGK